MKKITFSLFLFLSVFLSAQQWQWGRLLNHPGILGSKAEMATDANGDFYLKTTLDTAGTFEGVSLNKGTFIAKFTSSGVIQWAKNIPNAGQIKFNHQDLLCVTGFFTGSLSLGSFLAASHGGEDIYVAKFDPNGTVVEFKSFGGPGNDKGIGIDIGTNDKVFLTGSFEDSLSFSSFSLKNPNNSRGFYAACMDSSLNTLWAISDTLTSASAYDIAVDENNNSYVLGHYQDTSCYMYCTGDFTSGFDAFGNKNFTKAGSAAYGWHKLQARKGSLFEYGYACNPQYCSSFMSKNDLQMNLNWYKNWFDTYHINLTQGILSKNKESTVAGSFGSWAVQDSVKFDSIWVPLKGSNSDLIITKIDSIGNYQWFKTAGGYWDEGVFAITSDQAGNYFVFGWFLNAAGRADTLILDNDTLVGNGTPHQYFIAKLTEGATTSISFVSNDEEFLFYPNPSNGRISFRSVNNLKVRVFNCLGEVVSFTQSENEIVLNQPPGIYFIEIISDCKRIIRKLIIE